MGPGDFEAELPFDAETLEPAVYRLRHANPESIAIIDETLKLITQLTTAGSTADKTASALEPAKDQ